MRHQQQDDETYLQRGRNSIALGYSQRHMRSILIMAFHHRESLQTWFLLAHNQG
jgi:hypothetical protein